MKVAGRLTKSKITGKMYLKGVASLTFEGMGRGLPIVDVLVQREEGGESEHNCWRLCI